MHYGRRRRDAEDDEYKNEQEDYGYNGGRGWFYGQAGTGKRDSPKNG